MQSGPYHHPAFRMSGVWSLRVPDTFVWPSLLIACTGRIVTRSMNYLGYRQILRVPSIWPDAHHIVTDAEGSESTLGPFVMLRPILWAAGLITRSACRHAGRTVSSLQCSGSGVQSLRVPDQRAAWPSLLIACTYALSPVYHNICTSLVAQDTQVSQHIAGFFNVTTAVQPIVTAAVHRGFSSGLCLAANPSL